jgi:hypothetical protein
VMMLPNDAPRGTTCWACRIHAGFMQERAAVQVPLPLHWRRRGRALHGHGVARGPPGAEMMAAARVWTAGGSNHQDDCMLDEVTFGLCGPLLSGVEALQGHVHETNGCAHSHSSSVHCIICTCCYHTPSSQNPSASRDLGSTGAGMLLRV